MTVAVVVDLYRFALLELVGETKIGHIGSSGRTNGEETQTCRGNVVKFAITVGEKLITLLGGSVKAHRIVHTVVNTERHFFVATIYTA